MAPSKIIIDTDPGIDDVLAILLALCASPEEVELLLISLVNGNIPVRQALENAVSMFHIIERERQWRREQGRPEGFDSMRTFKPVLAVGADGPFLQEDAVIADYFHGIDGLGNVHKTHPHLSPQEAWEHAFHAPWPTDAANLASTTSFSENTKPFIPSKQPSHKEILRLLRENEPDTITIVAIGPLTNLAHALREDPDTFLRVKEIAIMGGTIDKPGNVTPVAEFNVYADPFASAAVYAYTSPNPLSTFPPKSQDLGFRLPTTSRRLKIQLFPLDFTTKHRLSRGQFRTALTPDKDAGSPLAEWLEPIVSHTFAKMDATHARFAESKGDDGTSMSLHDPVCAWYAVTGRDPAWKVTADSPRDIRVETLGQWAKGCCVVDRRPRLKIEGEEGKGPVSDEHKEEKRRSLGPEDEHAADAAKKADTKGADNGLWLTEGCGNRINVMLESPGSEDFGVEMMRRILG